MAQSKASSKIEDGRQEARAAADRIKHGFPPETAAPLPVAASLHLGADAVKHWLQTGQDMARFYNARLAKDFNYMAQFSACRSPMDVAALWSRAASEAAHDYVEQFQRVLAINLNGAGSAEEFDEV